MRLSLRVATVSALVVSALFIPAAAGRLSYFAFIWFSRVLGFSPAADLSLRAELMGAAIVGGLVLALHFLAAFAIIEHRSPEADGGS